MTQPLSDAILRAFIRYEIPPPPRDWKTRLLRYRRELGELVERRRLKQGAPGALREGEYREAVASLWADLEEDAKLIATDPRSYKYWQPTNDDWKALALLQAIKHGTDLKPARRERISSAGDPLWYRAIYAEKALAELAEKHGVRPEEVSQKLAASLTVQLIKAASERGLWPFSKIPTANTVESHWKAMGLGRPLIEIYYNPGPVPTAMQKHREWREHLAEVWQSADELGFANQMPPDFSEFAGWAFERVPAESRLPEDVKCWFHFHSRQVDASANERALYQKLLNEFTSPDVSAPRKKIAEWGVSSFRSQNPAD